MAGLDLTGFDPKGLSDIKTELGNAIKAQYGPNTRVNAQSFIGQLVGIFSEQFSELWAEAEKVYSTSSLSGASGSALDDLVALANITRQAATKSTVALNLVGTAATLVPAGREVSDQDSGTVWVIDADVTLTGGTDAATATAKNTGPVRALAGTITTIDTAVAGWSTVTNPTDADLGQDQETDAALRTRFQLSFFVAKSGVLGSLYGQLIRLDGVTDLNILENTSDDPDTNGLPGHSFEVVIQGGTAQEIVDTIGSGKGLAIETFGSSSGTFTNALGAGITINYTRPTSVDIYITVEYTGISGQFPNDGKTQIRDAILAHGNTLTTGDKVIPIQIVQDIEVAGLSHLEVKVGLSALNVFNLPLEINFRQLADIDSSRITVTPV